MIDLPSILISAGVGGLVGFGASYCLYLRQRTHEFQALAASLATEVEHLVAGLRTYIEVLEGNRSAAFHLNELHWVVEPPFRQADFRIFHANAGVIGQFPRDVARAIVGFYHFLETMPERVGEINRDVEVIEAMGKAPHSGRLAIVRTQSFITNTDTALSGGQALQT